MGANIVHKQKRVVIIGGGIFGMSTAIILGEQGYQVTLLEKKYDVMREASMANQNRIHLGYHYPRSAATARESLHGLTSFLEVYGSAIVSDFTKYYAISNYGSQITAEGFDQFCKEVELPLEPGWPSDSILNKKLVESCWIVPEKIFDYYELRQIAIQRIENCDSIRVLRNVWPVGIEVGPPHRITLNNECEISCDAIINATYAGLGDMERLIGVPPTLYQFELCVMPILEMDDPPSRFGITMMDGAFCSLMPKGRERGQFILYHVEHSVLQRETAFSCPSWSPVEGFVELRIMEACQELFPIIKKMRCRDSWITTRVVIPNRDKDDARPTTLLDYGPDIYSVFSGKLTTCVEVARKILTLMREELSTRALPI